MSINELTAAAFNSKNSVLTPNLVTFPMDVMESVSEDGKCAVCSKKKHGNNLTVCPIYDPIPSSTTYNAKMKMKSFILKTNAVLLCSDCSKKYKSGDKVTTNAVMKTK
jgi:hypothetical protein